MVVSSQELSICVILGLLAFTTTRTIGHVNEYPTMHYFGIPGHTQYMIAYILTEYFWKFRCKNALW